jgi:hypothetical protein
MTKYFCLGSVIHNKQDFKRGDEIDLSDEAAAPLLEVKAIQTEAVTEIAPEPEQVIEQPKPEVVVGGERPQTGEPSFDGPQETSAPAPSKGKGKKAKAEEPENDPSANL